MWRIWAERGTRAGLALMVVALLLPRHWASYGLALVLLSLLLLRWVTRVDWRVLLMRLGFPAVVALALLWSSDRAQGLREAGVALVLVAAALVVSSGGVSAPNARLLRRLLVLTAVIAVAWMLLHGVGLYALTGYRGHLGYHGLASATDRTAPYVAYLLAAALLVLLGTDAFGARSRWALGAVLALGLLLLAVKAALLALALALPFSLRLRPHMLWRLGAALGLALMLAWVALPTLRQRVNEAMASDWSLLGRRDFAYEDVYLPELPLRVLLWRESWAAGAEHRLAGHGTGAQTAALHARLEALRLHPRLTVLNSHNQYLHTLLTQGVLGLLMLGALGLGWARGGGPNACTRWAVLVFFGLVGLSEVWLARHDGAYLFAVLMVLLSAGGAPHHGPSTRADSLRTAG